MSNVVFPTLPGQNLDVTLTPEFSTSVKRAASGKEVRFGLHAYPTWQIDIVFEFLSDGARGDDLETLVGFFLQRRGAFDSFLFAVPSDSAVVGQEFAVGDGVTATFQLARAYGGFVEPVMNLAGTPQIYADGVLVTPVSIGSTGMVTLSPVPALGVVLTWSGSYYYRCRFARDSAAYRQFLKDLWECRKVQLLGAPGDRV